MNKTLGTALLASVLGGCAISTTPNYDLRFGDAVRQARQQMTLNPDAGSTSAPIVGMDAKSAHEATVRYQDSFKAPPAVVNVINIGGSPAGGK